jgi:hypothetical protein
MPSIRIGFSTDFNLTGEQIGIGTTNPTARLDVAGQIRSDDSAGSGGVSTVTRYAGFLDEAQGLGNNVSIAETTKGNLNSLSGEIKISGEVTVTEDTKLTGGRLDSLTVTGKFDLPHGGSEDREDTPEKGSTRFNQDLGQLEFYTGYEWRTVNSYARPGGGGRALFAGGSDPGAIATIQTVQISTRGNAQYFGDRTIAKGIVGGFGNETRGVFAGGSTSGFTDIIDYVTTASSGDAIDFGDLLTAAGYIGGLSSSTRGIMVGDYTPGESNVIQYVQINTTGDAVDFGDLTLARLITSGACASPTRGVMGGGWLPSNRSDVIDYITIASAGNAIDFGDLTQIKSACSAGSTGTRAVWAGGYKNISPILEHYKTVEYITIASGGNGIDFGERTFAGAYSGAASSHTRLVTCMGFTPTLTNRMDSIEMTTGGDAIDFGDAVTAANAPGGCSDSHGGLGGF